MLPFIKKNRPIAAATIVSRTPDGSTEDETMDDEGLESCATDLLRAINTKDTTALASALRAAFEILDSEQPNETISEED